MNDVVKAAPRGLQDRSKGPVCWIPEGNQQGALFVVGESDYLLSERLVAANGLAAGDTEPCCRVIICIAAWPRSDRSIKAASPSAFGTTTAIVADEPVIQCAPCQTCDRRCSWRLSDTTTKSQRCSFREDGDRRPASRILLRSSFETGSDVKLLTCLREVMASQVSMATDSSQRDALAARGR